MRNTLFAAACVLISCNSIALSQIIDLPVPTGPESVGTTVFYWEDRLREEPWTDDGSDCRRLAVQLWYPAAKKPRGVRAPYIINKNRIKESIERYWPEMPAVSISSALDVPLRKSKTKFPLVVFSHGMNSSRWAYTALSQELASHGYIVAAIDHSFWGPGIYFPNSKSIGFADGMIARDTLTSKDIDRMMYEGIDVMVEDQEFVVRRLLATNARDNRFAGYINHERIASIGHSMGGMAATLACLRYTDFKACISLDGPIYNLNKMPGKSKKPFLLLLNSQWGRNALPKIKNAYIEAWEYPSVAVVNGTKHSSFSDIPLIEASKIEGGLLSPLRAFKIISSYTTAFLNKSFGSDNRKLPDFAEFELVDLKTVNAAAEEN